MMTKEASKEEINTNFKAINVVMEDVREIHRCLMKETKFV